SYVLCLSFEYEFAILKITAYKFEISGDSYDLTSLENTVNPLAIVKTNPLVDECLLFNNVQFTLSPEGWRPLKVFNGIPA
ncbi:unnamed protein product, partial [marine sediment metagenome]